MVKKEQNKKHVVGTLGGKQQTKLNSQSEF